MFKFFAVLILFFIPLAVFGQTIEKKVFIPAVNDDGNRYFYILFDVPQNTKSLTLT